MNLKQGEKFIRRESWNFGPMGIGTMQSEEKRRHPRLDSLLLVAYTVYEENGTMVSRGMGRTLNLSESGILFETQLPIEAGQIIEMNMGVREDIIQVRGKAVYSRKGDGDTVEAGIEFEAMDEDRKEILRRFLKESVK